MEVDKNKGKEKENGDAGEDMVPTTEAEVLIEDDDFEEFEAEDWDAGMIDEGELEDCEWEDDWDDEVVDEDFSAKLQQVIQSGAAGNKKS